MAFSKEQKEFFRRLAATQQPVETLSFPRPTTQSTSSSPSKPSSSELLRILRRKVAAMDNNTIENQLRDRDLARQEEQRQQALEQEATRQAKLYQTQQRQADVERDVAANINRLNRAEAYAQRQAQKQQASSRQEQQEKGEHPFLGYVRDRNKLIRRLLRTGFVENFDPNTEKGRETVATGIDDIEEWVRKTEAAKRPSRLGNKATRVPYNEAADPKPHNPKFIEIGNGIHQKVIDAFPGFTKVRGIGDTDHKLLPLLNTIESSRDDSQDNQSILPASEIDRLEKKFGKKITFAQKRPQSEASTPGDKYRQWLDSVNNQSSQRTIISPEWQGEAREKLEKVIRLTQAYASMMGGQHPIEALLQNIPSLYDAYTSGGMPRRRIADIYQNIQDFAEGKISKATRNTRLARLTESASPTMFAPGGASTVDFSKLTSRAQYLQAREEKKEQTNILFGLLDSFAKKEPGLAKKIIKDLSHEQYDFTTSPAQIQVLEGGAGTGKTHTMAARMTYLASQGKQVQNYPILTPTHSAGRAITERLNKFAPLMKAAPNFDYQTIFHFVMSYLHKPSVFVGENEYGEAMHISPWKKLIEKYPQFKGYEPMGSKAIDPTQMADSEELEHAIKKQRFTEEGYVKALKDKYRVNDFNVDGVTHETGDLLNHVKRLGSIRTVSPDQWNDAFTSGKESYYANNQTVTNPNAFFYLYEAAKNMHPVMQNGKATDELFHIPEQESPVYDLMDLLYLGTLAANKVDGPKYEGALIDEAQDIPQQFFPFLAAVTRPDSHIILGGDLSQKVIYNDDQTYEIAKQQLMKHRNHKDKSTFEQMALTGSYRLNMHNSAFAASINADPAMDGRPKSPFMVSARTDKHSWGEMPEWVYKPTFRDLDRESINLWMQDMGLTWKDVQQNLADKKTPFAGHHKDYIPEKNPFIFMMHPRRAKFEEHLLELLKQEFGHYEGANVFKQIYASGSDPNVNPEGRLRALMMSESRSHEYDNTTVDFTRVGGRWQYHEYLSQLFTMATRSRGKLRLIGAGQNMGGTYDNSPDMHPYTMEPIPHGARDIMKRMIDNLVYQQGMPAELIPDEWRSLLESPLMAEEQPISDLLVNADALRELGSYLQFAQDQNFMQPDINPAQMGMLDAQGLSFNELLERDPEDGHQGDSESGYSTHAINPGAASGKFGMEADQQQIQLALSHLREIARLGPSYLTATGVDKYGESYQKMDEIEGLLGNLSKESAQFARPKKNPLLKIYGKDEEPIAEQASTVIPTAGRIRNENTGVLERYGDERILFEDLGKAADPDDTKLSDESLDRVKAALGLKKNASDFDVYEAMREHPEKMYSPDTLNQIRQELNLPQHTSDVDTYQAMLAHPAIKNKFMMDSIEMRSKHAAYRLLSNEYARSHAGSRLLLTEQFESPHGQPHIVDAINKAFAREMLENTPTMRHLRDQLKETEHPQKRQLIQDQIKAMQREQDRIAFSQPLGQKYLGEQFKGTESPFAKGSLTQAARLEIINQIANDPEDWKSKRVWETAAKNVAYRGGLNEDSLETINDLTGFAITQMHDLKKKIPNTQSPEHEANRKFLEQYMEEIYGNNQFLQKNFIPNFSDEDRRESGPVVASKEHMAYLKKHDPRQSHTLKSMITDDKGDIHPIINESGKKINMEVRHQAQTIAFAGQNQKELEVTHPEMANAMMQIPLQELSDRLHKGGIFDPENGVFDERNKVYRPEGSRVPLGAYITRLGEQLGRHIPQAQKAVDQEVQNIPQKQQRLQKLARIEHKLMGQLGESPAPGSQIEMANALKHRKQRRRLLATIAKKREKQEEELKQLVPQVQSYQKELGKLPAQKQQQLAMAKQLHALSLDPEKQDLHSHYLNIVAQAIYGERPNWGNISEEERKGREAKGRVEPRRHLFQNQRDYRKPGMYTLENMHAFYKTLEEGTQHLQKERSLNRGHINELLRTLGHDPQDKVFQHLRFLEGKQQFQHEDSTVTLENLIHQFAYNDDRQRIAYQEFTPYPIHPTEKMVFTGQVMKMFQRGHLQPGMVGSLEPFPNLNYKQMEALVEKAQKGGTSWDFEDPKIQNDPNAAGFYGIIPNYHILSNLGLLSTKRKKNILSEYGFDPDITEKKLLSSIDYERKLKDKPAAQAFLFRPEGSEKAIPVIAEQLTPLKYYGPATPQTPPPTPPTPDKDILENAGEQQALLSSAPTEPEPAVLEAAGQVQQAIASAPTSEQSGAGPIAMSTALENVPPSLPSSLIQQELPLNTPIELPVSPENTEKVVQNADSDARLSSDFSESEEAQPVRRRNIQQVPDFLSDIPPMNFPAAPIETLRPRIVARGQTPVESISNMVQHQPWFPSQDMVGQFLHQNPYGELPKPHTVMQELPPEPAMPIQREQDIPLIQAPSVTLPRHIENTLPERAQQPTPILLAQEAASLKQARAWAKARRERPRGQANEIKNLPDVIALPAYQEPKSIKKTSRRGPPKEQGITESEQNKGISQSEGKRLDSGVLLVPAKSKIPATLIGKKTSPSQEQPKARSSKWEYAKTPEDPTQYIDVMTDQEELERLGGWLHKGNIGKVSDKKSKIFAPSEEQLKAIALGGYERHKIIMGGPGSGKTATLARAIMHRVTSGEILPDEMISLSATRSGVGALNKALQEYKDHLPTSSKAYNIPEAKTFHQLAHSIIFSHAHPYENGGRLHYPVMEKLGYDFTGRVISYPDEEKLLHMTPEERAEAEEYGPHGFLRTALESQGLQLQGSPEEQKMQLDEYLEAIGSFKKQRSLEKSGGEDVFDKAYGTGLDHLAKGHITANSAFVAYQKQLQQTGAIDLDDYPYLGALALQHMDFNELPSDLKNKRQINIDETQDMTHANLSMAKSLTDILERGGNEPHVYAGLDPMQSLMQSMGGIDIEQILSHLTNWLHIPLKSVHRLTKNFRSDANAVALNNAILQHPALKNQAKSDLQVPTTSERGADPHFVLAKSQPTLYRKMFHNMLASVGTTPQEIAANILAGDTAFHGKKWQEINGKEMMPSEAPAIFSTRKQQQLFQREAVETLKQAGLSHHQATETFRHISTNKVLRADESSKEKKDEMAMKFPILRVGGARSLQFLRPHFDVTRVGGWLFNNQMTSYLRNLYTGISRVSQGGVNSLYSTERPFTNDQYASYMKDPSQFVETQPENIHGGSVRLNGQAILPNEQNYFEEYKGKTVPANFKTILQKQDEQLQTWAGQGLLGPQQQQQEAARQQKEQQARDAANLARAQRHVQQQQQQPAGYPAQSANFSMQALNAVQPSMSSPAAPSQVSGNTTAPGIQPLSPMPAPQPVAPVQPATVPGSRPPSSLNQQGPAQVPIAAPSQKIQPIPTGGGSGDFGGSHTPAPAAPTPQPEVDPHSSEHQETASKNAEELHRVIASPDLLKQHIQQHIQSVPVPKGESIQILKEKTQLANKQLLEQLEKPSRKLPDWWKSHADFKDIKPEDVPASIPTGVWAYYQKMMKDQQRLEKKQKTKKSWSLPENVQEDIQNVRDFLAYSNPRKRRQHLEESHALFQESFQRYLKQPGSIKHARAALNDFTHLKYAQQYAGKEIIHDLPSELKPAKDYFEKDEYGKNIEFARDFEIGEQHLIPPLARDLNTLKKRFASPFQHAYQSIAQGISHTSQSITHTYQGISSKIRNTPAYLHYLWHDPQVTDDILAFGHKVGELGKKVGTKIAPPFLKMGNKIKSLFQYHEPPEDPGDGMETRRLMQTGDIQPPRQGKFSNTSLPEFFKEVNETKEQLAPDDIQPPRPTLPGGPVNHLPGEATQKITQHVPLLPDAVKEQIASAPPAPDTKASPKDIPFVLSPEAEEYAKNLQYHPARTATGDYLYHWQNDYHQQVVNGSRQTWQEYLTQIIHSRHSDKKDTSRAAMFRAEGDLLNPLGPGKTPADFYPPEQPIPTQPSLPGGEMQTRPIIGNLTPKMGKANRELQFDPSLPPKNLVQKLSEDMLPSEEDHVPLPPLRPVSERGKPLKPFLESKDAPSNVIPLTEEQREVITHAPSAVKQIEQATHPIITAGGFTKSLSESLTLRQSELLKEHEDIRDTSKGAKRKQKIVDALKMHQDIAKMSLQNFTNAQGDDFKTSPLSSRLNAAIVDHMILRDAQKGYGATPSPWPEELRPAMRKLVDVASPFGKFIPDDELLSRPDGTVAATYPQNGASFYTPPWPPEEERKRLESEGKAERNNPLRKINIDPYTGKVYSGINPDANHRVQAQSNKTSSSSSSQQSTASQAAPTNLSIDQADIKADTVIVQTAQSGSSPAPAQAAAPLFTQTPNVTPSSSSTTSSSTGAGSGNPPTSTGNSGGGSGNSGGSRGSGQSGNNKSNEPKQPTAYQKWNNEESQAGRSIARVGSELQFLGQLFSSMTDQALQQGSDYRRATIPLGASVSGANGTSGFFDFGNRNSGINKWREQGNLTMYSDAELAKMIQEYSAQSNTLTSVSTLKPVQDIASLSALTGIDSGTLTQQFTSLNGYAGNTAQANNARVDTISGMLTNLYGTNLTASNVEPTMQALDSIVPTLQGLNSSSGTDQTSQAMAFMKLALGAGYSSNSMGDVAKMMGNLSDMGRNPNLQQQYALSQLFGSSNMTADTELVNYNTEEHGRQQQLAQLQLEQNIGNGESLPQLQIQISQAQVTMDRAQLDMSSFNQQYAQAQYQQAQFQQQYNTAQYQQSQFQYQQNVAQFNENQYVQNQEYGPIGADVSRTSYYNFQRNQLAAGYDPMNPETSTQFKPSQTFGLKNEEFYAGMENQRNMLTLQRSSLLSDQAYQQQMKNINQQEDFYKRELDLQNQQRAFQKDWGQRSLDVQNTMLGWQKKSLDVQNTMLGWQKKQLDKQAGILALQEKQFGLQAQMADYEQKQYAIQGNYLATQVSDLQAIMIATQQQVQGQGPVNGQNVTPEMIIQALANQKLSDKDLQGKIQGLGLPTDEQKMMFDLVKELQKTGSMSDIEKKLSGANGAQMRKDLQGAAQNGAFADQSWQADLKNAFLQLGGTKDNWNNLVKSAQDMGKNLQTIAQFCSAATPIMMTMGTIFNILGPVLMGIASVFNILGVFKGIGGLFSGGAAADATGAAGAAGSVGTFGAIAAGAIPVGVAATVIGSNIFGWNMVDTKDPNKQNPWWTIPFQSFAGLDLGYKAHELWGAWTDPNYAKGRFGQSGLDQINWVKNIPSNVGNFFGGLGNDWNNFWNPPNTTPQTVPTNNPRPLMSHGGGPLIQTYHPPTNAVPDQNWWTANIAGPIGNYFNKILPDWWNDNPKKLFTQVVPKWWGDRGNDWHNFWNGVSKWWADRKVDWTNFWGGIGNDWTNFWNDRGKDAKNFLNTILPNLLDGNMWKPFKIVLNTLTGGWSDKVINGFTNLQTFFQKSIPDTWNKATAPIGAFFKGLPKWFDDNIGKAWKDATDIVKKLNPLNLFNHGSGGSASTGSTPAGHPGFITPHVNQEFGVMNAQRGMHEGVDLAVDQGTIIGEFVGGTVVNNGHYPWGWEEDVDIGGGVIERYVHLSQLGASVGQKLKPGDFVGLSGGGTPDSGLGWYSDGPHLHIEYDAGGLYVDPVSPWRVWQSLGDYDISQFIGKANFNTGPATSFSSSSSNTSRIQNINGSGGGGTRRGTGGSTGETQAEHQKKLRAADPHNPTGIPVHFLSQADRKAHLYQGGIAMQRMQAVIAEHEPEAVIPISKLTSILQSTFNQNRSSSPSQQATSSSSSNAKSSLAIAKIAERLELHVHTSAQTLDEQAQDDLMAQLLDIFNTAIREFNGKLNS